MTMLRFTLWTVSLLLPAVFAQDPGLMVSVLPTFYPGAFDGFAGDVTGFEGNTPTRPKTYYSYIFTLDFAPDPVNERMFVLDGQSNTLFEYSGVSVEIDRTKIERKVLHTGISFTSYARVAYDWLAGNIYWTDSKFNWICMQPVNITDKSLYSVVAHAGIRIPIAVAVDPINRLLFFAEHSTVTGYIEKANLDGSNRKVIYKAGYYINDMTADIEEKRIYWVDNNENAVLSCDYDGNDKVIVLRKSGFSGYIASIDIIGDVLCISEYKYEYLLCMTKTDGNTKWRYQYPSYRYNWVARIFDKKKYKMVDHGCKNNNCDHICLNTVDGHKCVCADGYELETVNNTCVASHQFYARGLLVANNTEICMLEKGIVLSDTTEGLSKCALTWNATITSLAANAKKNYIFFSDSRSIYKFDAVQNTTVKVTDSQSISSLAYDWNDEYIYWTEKTTGKISAIPTKPGTTANVLTVYSGIPNPSSLAINPHNYSLFWVSEQNKRYQIQGGTFSGSTKWTLAEDGALQKPVSLYFDIQTNRVYWINNGMLRYMKTDGTGSQSLHRARDDTMLVIYRDWVISTDGEDSLVRNFKNTINTGSAVIATPDYPKITAIAVFDDITQRPEKGPCEIDNGGCQKFCVPEASNRRSCACGNGYKLINDVNCTTISPPLTKDFALVVDYTHSQILQIDINNPAHFVPVDIKIRTYPVSAVYSMPTKKLYWSDVSTELVMRSDINGDNIESLYRTGRYYVYSMSVDPSTDNIYYAADAAYEDSTPFLGVLSTKNGKHKRIHSGLETAWSIAVYPSEAMLFFTEGGEFTYSGYIGRVQMDGSSPIALVSRGIALPNSIALDFSRADRPDMVRLYWVDSLEDSIYSINTNGDDRQTLLQDADSSLAHLAIAGGYVYYSATMRQNLMRAKIITASYGKIEKSWMDGNEEFGRFESIDIYPGDTVPVHRPCSINNGQCSTFCLPSSAKIGICACEDGVALKSDHRTCRNVKSCTGEPINGMIEITCTRLVNVTCQYSCYPGYKKKSNNGITCKEDLHDGKWDMTLRTMCVAETALGTASPLTGTAEKSESVSVTAMVIVVLALLLAFFIIYCVTLYVLNKRRGGQMFAHAKFVNSGNFSIDPSSAENSQSTISAPGPKHNRGDGMENPLYNAKNQQQKENPYENTLASHDQITLEVPMKF